MTEEQNAKDLITPEPVENTTSEADVAIIKAVMNNTPTLGSFELGGIEEQLLNKAASGAALRADGGEIVTTVAGVQEPKYDPEKVRDLRSCSSYHARCIQSKGVLTCGFGFKDKTVRRVMNKLCPAGKTFQMVMTEVAQDYWEHGRGYLEVSLDDGGEIRGVHHRAAADVRVVTTEITEQGTGEDATGTEVVLQGDHHFVIKVDGVDHYIQNFDVSDDDFDPGAIVEDFVDGTKLIEFKQPDNKGGPYPEPAWISVVPQLELSNAANNHFFDLFYNRGVPAMALLLARSQISPQGVDELVKTFQKCQGPGNTSRTVVAAIPGQSTEMMLKQLAASEGQEEMLEKTTAVISQSILSAHGMPPVLAGVQIPGKMASANEIPNVMALLQTMEIGPVQVYFSERLADTFGNDSSIDLSYEAFSPDPEDMKAGMDAPSDGTLPSLDCNGFVALTDKQNMLMMQSAARMKDPAMGPERDTSAGLARNSRDGEGARGGS